MRIFKKKNESENNDTLSKREGMLEDIDGNIYNTIKIGDQVWTAENLKTSKFIDETPITFVKANFEIEIDWVGLETPAYCWYDGEIENKDKFGALYNWYAVDSGKLAPEGWHVPTDTEWAELIEYLISNGYNWDGSTEKNKVAKSLAANSDWINLYNPGMKEGTIGKDPSMNNSTGFSALPAGSRYYLNGHYLSKGLDACWWTATEYNENEAWYHTLLDGLIYSYRDKINKGNGFSVRLVKDH